MSSHRSRTALIAVCIAASLSLFALAASASAATTSLSVTRSGLQQATVVDGEGQINCGTDCAGSYEQVCVTENSHGACIGWANAAVTLTTSPPAGFGAVWSGHTCAEGTNTGNTCTVSATGTVNAHFTDLTAPTVTLTSPASGPVRGTIGLAATASDSQTGIQGVQFRVGGVPVGTADTTAPFGVSYDTTSRADGSVQVSAVATNNDGSTSTSSATVTIDNTAPGLSATGPDGGTYGPGSTQAWALSATDATSGVSSVQCSLTAASAAASYSACSGGSTAHSATGLAPGEYTFRARATDATGNTTVVTRSFSIDGTAPQTTITSGPADGSSSSNPDAGFGFTADDPGASFSCRLYATALTPPAFVSCPDGSHSANGLPPGSYTFEVRATDAYGNVDSTPSKRTFTVTAPPAGGTGDGQTAPGGSTSEATGPQPDKTAPQPDKTAPVASLTVGKQKLGTVVSKAFAASGKSNEAGKLRLELVLSGKDAKKLKLTRKAAPVVIGKSADKPLARPGTMKFSVKLSKAAKRALRGLRKVKLTVRLVATDAAGNSSVTLKTVTLKR